jgi:hypothetical protein
VVVECLRLLLPLLLLLVAVVVECPLLLPLLLVMPQLPLGVSARQLLLACCRR